MRNHHQACEERASAVQSAETRKVLLKQELGTKALHTILLQLAQIMYRVDQLSNLC
jgi:hypothetical protein